MDFKKNGRVTKMAEKRFGKSKESRKWTGKEARKVRNGGERIPASQGKAGSGLEGSPQGS